MRSEKEIKDRIEILEKSKHKIGIDGVINLEWVLEGEPRYSIAELKIMGESYTDFLIKKFGDATDEQNIDEFLEFITNQKKVQEALK